MLLLFRKQAVKRARQIKQQRYHRPQKRHIVQKLGRRGAELPVAQLLHNGARAFAKRLHGAFLRAVAAQRTQLFKCKQAQPFLHAVPVARCESGKSLFKLQQIAGKRGAIRRLYGLVLRCQRERAAQQGRRMPQRAFGIVKDTAPPDGIGRAHAFAVIGELIVQPIVVKWVRTYKIIERKQRIKHPAVVTARA